MNGNPLLIYNSSSPLFAEDLQGGIYAANNDGLSYAGYFCGNVYSTGSYYPSDGKLKQNVKGLNSAMALLSKLQPKEYEYKQDGNYKLMHLPKGKRYGLIAEELEEVFPGLVKKTTFDSRSAQKPDSIYGSQATASERIEFKAVNYTELIPIIVKGMQEQEEAIEAKDQRIANLETAVTELRQMVLGLKNGTTNTGTLNSAYLEQNTPNPVNGVAIIRFYIPETSGSAKLIVTSAKGQVVKMMAIDTKG